ncbi:hypothetical protein GOM44_03255 [Wolbachia endosymbiont of Atemnus politus]|uniref:hypothetical protein n=1 Tax=Wolbachia endosymbiont of Atemnus politus TaxID=2682840 RepID=UPI001572B92A|nr:hypothetical protein [Wolbachia endosymbiont of Atemnus politus]NSX83433.1 hypothetical protein [Wolbachia endosymbiont of Atemnus politus]
MLNTKTNWKWLAIGVGSLLFVMMLPSVFLLAKIAIGLITIAIATIAMKTLVKVTSNTSEEKKTEQNQVAQQTTRSKIVVGLTSISVLLLSAFTIVSVGLIAAVCAAVAVLVLYDHLQDKEIGKGINNKFDEAANYTINFITSLVEKPTESKNCQV